MSGMSRSHSNRTSQAAPSIVDLLGPSASQCQLGVLEEETSQSHMVTSRELNRVRSVQLGSVVSSPGSHKSAASHAGSPTGRQSVLRSSGQSAGQSQRTSSRHSAGTGQPQPQAQSQSPLSKQPAVRASTGSKASSRASSAAQQEDPAYESSSQVGPQELNSDELKDGVMDDVQSSLMGSAITASGPACQLDELELLNADTPMAKLERREAIADKRREEGDDWGALRLRQEILALAKIHQMLQGLGHNSRPLLVATAHYKLAQGYSDLGCVPQTTDHCKRAMEELPKHGQSQEVVTAFISQVNVLLAEALLRAEEPKPAVALKHLMAAAGCTGEVEDIPDLGLRLLASQCLTMLGDAKLAEARATQSTELRHREALDILQDKIYAAEQKARGTSMGAADQKAEARSMDSLRQRLSDLSGEADEEHSYMLQLASQALDFLNKTVATTYTAHDDESKRLKSETSQHTDNESKVTEHPMIALLSREMCEAMLKVASCHGLSGNEVDQLRTLGEIMSWYVAGNCPPLALVARTLKEQGAVLCSVKRYDEAIVSYGELMKVQEERYANADASRTALARAECLKLQGDVYVGKRLYRRAEEHFQKAIGLYSQQFGDRAALVLDLEHRLDGLREYLEAS